MDYYLKKFTDKEIEEFKKITDRKNKILDYNNLDKNFETRWIGIPCELAFREFLDKNNFKYKHWTTFDRKDDRDFTIIQPSKFEIDVKGISTNYFPRNEYACNITEKQWIKLDKKENIVDTFVFVRYWLPENTAIVVGAISKSQFKEKCEYCVKGTERGKIVLSTNNYEVPINELKTIEEFFLPK